MQVELHSFFPSLLCAPVGSGHSTAISRLQLDHLARSQHRALTWEQDGQARVDRGDCGSVWRAQYTRDVREILEKWMSSYSIAHLSTHEFLCCCIAKDSKSGEPNSIQSKIQWWWWCWNLFDSFLFSLLLCAARSTLSPPRHFIAMLLARWSLLDASGGHKIDIKSRFSLSHSEVIYTRNSNKRRKKNFMRFLQLLFIVNELELMDRVLFSRLSLFTPPRRRRFSLSHRQCSAIHFFLCFTIPIFQSWELLVNWLDSLLLRSLAHIISPSSSVVCHARPRRSAAKQNDEAGERWRERENINTEISPPFCVLGSGLESCRNVFLSHIFFRLS